MSLDEQYLSSALRQFKTYKALGDKTFGQLKEEEVNYTPGPDSNSIALVVKHMHGNMISRWTDFLTSDGEKPNRNRDQEFEGKFSGKSEMLRIWEEGWKVLFASLEALKPEDLLKTVLIRNEPHTVLEAINRQLAHYPYHVGQIVFLGKMIRKGEWSSLSIPKGKSEEFNKKMFGK